MDLSSHELCQSTDRRNSERGFTFAEVLVALCVCVLFGLAAFQTNQRLLKTLKAEKETTAAIMALQERKETLRAMTFTNIATADTLLSALNNKTGSEAPLADLHEQVTVNVDANDATYTNPTPTPTILRRDLTHASAQKISENTNLPNIDLIRVDILLSWTSADGKTRSRQTSELFGHGNIGQ